MALPVEVVQAQVHAVNERVTAHSERNDRAHADHEGRIRALELAQAKAMGFLAAAGALGALVGGLLSSGLSHWLWGGR